CLQDIQLPRTF
nr:immunoglobulin light chain junction region [Macaca mulatta]